MPEIDAGSYPLAKVEIEASPELRDALTFDQQSLTVKYDGQYDSYLSQNLFTSILIKLVNSEG